MIPSEIKRLGDKAVEIYLQALNEGKEKIPYCSMLILGREEVGKTSLFRQLVGKPYLKDMERTQGIDNSIVETLETKNVCTIEEQWAVRGDGDQSEQFGNALAGEFMNRLPDRQSKQRKHVSKSDLLSQLQEFSLEKTSQPHSKLEAESKPKPRQLTTEFKPSEHVNLSEVQQSQSPSQSTVTADTAISIPLLNINPQPKPVISPVTPSAPLKQPNTNIPAMLNPRESAKLNEIVINAQSYVRKEPEPCLNVKDFAGQIVYRPMHHCYINREAIYIVVFKLPDMLNYIHDSSNLKYNPLDDICYWIRSIHAHTYSSSNRKMRRVLLVGTYRDKLPSIRKNIKEIDKFIEKNVVNDKKRPYSKYVYPMYDSPSACRFIIPVENSLDIVSNPDTYLQESGTKYVQDTVIAMAKSLPQFSQQYPIKWLKFEEHLQQYCIAHKSTPVIKIEEAKELAVKSDITDKQQQELSLQFFNDTGKLNWLSKCRVLSSGGGGGEASPPKCLASPPKNLFQ